MTLKELVKKPLYRVYERRLLEKLDRKNLPRHIGVIHDGHRRYAKAEGLRDYAQSYRVGTQKFLELLSWTDELDIPVVTCWLLSMENLERPIEQLDELFDVFIELFEAIPEAIHGHSVEVRFIGSLDLLPVRLADAAKALREQCPEGDRLLTIALAYGGRQEIVDATRELVAKLANGGMDAADIAAQIDADAIAAHLYTSGMPDPDLVIRTSGEARLSGFLLWQSAYAEYSFVDVYWPAFRRVDFLRALRDFSLRERRFGR